MDKKIIVKIFIIYATISFLEWSIHKFIMHGNEEKLRRIPILGKYMADTAREHLDHHKEVQMD